MRRKKTGQIPQSQSLSGVQRQMTNFVEQTRAPVVIPVDEIILDTARRCPISQGNTPNLHRGLAVKLVADNGLCQSVLVLAVRKSCVECVQAPPGPPPPSLFSMT